MKGGYLQRWVVLAEVLEEVVAAEVLEVGVEVVVGAQTQYAPFHRLPRPRRWLLVRCVCV